IESIHCFFDSLVWKTITMNYRLRNVIQTVCLGVYMYFFFLVLNSVYVVCVEICCSHPSCTRLTLQHKQAHKKKKKTFRDQSINIFSHTSSHVHAA
uniref:Uncharacterized protein n=1 Tax=Labrus bergylta TaxID=56723 RepID=A0A3Q3LLI1_9LABR